MATVLQNFTKFHYSLVLSEYDLQSHRAVRLIRNNFPSQCYQTKCYDRCHMKPALNTQLKWPFAGGSKGRHHLCEFRKKLWNQISKSLTWLWAYLLSCGGNLLTQGAVWNQKTCPLTQKNWKPAESDSKCVCPFRTKKIKHSLHVWERSLISVFLGHSALPLVPFNGYCLTCKESQ